MGQWLVVCEGGLSGLMSIQRNSSVDLKSFVSNHLIFFFVGQKNVTKYDSTILKLTGLFGMKVHSFCPMRSLQVQITHLSAASTTLEIFLQRPFPLP